MFERLKRAKSFVVRTKTREELDLSESSHLRRNVAINSSVIDRQKKLTAARTPQKNDPNKAQAKLSRPTSSSHERIYDDRLILEQIRRINFGDSRNSARNEVLNYYYAKNGQKKDGAGKTAKDQRQGVLETNERRPRREGIVKK